MDSTLEPQPPEQAHVTQPGLEKDPSPPLDPKSGKPALPWRVAKFATQHRRLAYIAVALLIAISALEIVFGVHFASDVLDLLPQHFDSVQIFKTYDREFSQARELTFAVLDETREVDLDGFTEHFAEALRQEPWITRVMDRSPVETPAGVQEVQGIAVPMLLNLPTADFQQAVAVLEPAAIDARLAKLHSEIEAGSPKAEFQLDFDPLGLVAPAMKPLAGSFSLEQTRPLASPDGTLRIVLAVSKQEDLGAHACQETMRRVEEFKARVLASWEGAKPQILVTGRTPYVGELSLKMRADVISTLLTSALLVAGVFWIGFRRFRPLFAILHVLLLCCVAAVAVGALFFHELNMITIGLCSILIGLGVDFGMMLYSIYEIERDAGHSHREAIARALQREATSIIFGSLTTAAAFLCLTRSDCLGFSQLGVLIAIGILFAGAFMMTLFFVFLGERHRPQSGAAVRRGGQRFVDFVFARPKLVFATTAALLVGALIIAVAPIGRLEFEANPRSLEPLDSNAGRALRTITAKMPGIGEPILVLLNSKDADEASRNWTNLNEAWSGLAKKGLIRSAATPAAFCISPQRVAANAATLSSEKIEAARAALRAAIEREGMRSESFGSALAVLDALASASQSGTAQSWQQALPPDSSWWFILDKFFGKNPLVAVAYITPREKLTSFAQKEELRKNLTVPGVDAHYSGWTYTLADLVPWAKGKLAELTAIMLALNVLLLLFLYRSAFPLMVLMTSLALSVAAMLATLKFLGVSLNLFNVLAFPLVLGVGVDYGIYIVVAMRTGTDPKRSVAMIVKPVLLSGLTTVAGFASLVTAQNPALRGLGVVCAVGVGWCLFSTFFFILPLYVWRRVR